MLRIDGSRLISFLLVAIFSGCLGAPLASASEDLNFGEVTNIEILGGGKTQPSVQVIEETAGGLTLEFELPSLRSQSMDFEGASYQALEIEGGGEAGHAGEPLLPTFSRFIQVPAESGITIEVLSTDTRVIKHILPLPVQPAEADGFTKDEAIYAGQDYGSTPLAQVGGPVIARDLRLVPVTFSPVRCNPSSRSIEVAGRITVQVTFDGQDGRNVKQGHHRTLSRSFDQMYRHLVVNYGGARVDQTVGLGSYVIICPDDAEAVQTLQPLVEWRARKGYDVTLVTTAETGISANEIRAWLINAYETWENPPEYIALVGDTGGSIAIPHFSQSGGPTDHDYCQLDGDDLLADAHVGRISVTSIDELELYVDKIVNYESNPTQGDAGWRSRACVVGDPSSSGPTTIQSMQWLKDRLLDWGYSRVDTVFSSPFVTLMRYSLENGVGVFAYRGYWGMSGWDTGDIHSLQNDHMLPYCVNLTCGTGTFNSGEAISEAWIRAGVVGSPTGGIASIGTATIFTHTRYNNCMNYGVWRAIFWEDNFHFGASLTRGKYELYLNYQEWDPVGARDFTHWNNLMGDPGGEMWTNTPQSMAVSHDTEIALGTNVIRVQATSGGYPLAGVYVHLWRDGDVQMGAYTGPDGFAEIPFGAQATGDVYLTGSKHDYAPYLATLTVVDPDQYVTYESHVIDDDDLGDSSGNSDGQANPLEVIELPVQVRNAGFLLADDVIGTLSTNDPYVTIHDNSETFGSIGGGASAWSAEDYDISIAAGAPDGHQISLGLTLASGAADWYSIIQFPIAAAAFDFGGYTTGGFGEQIDPGESGTIAVTLVNGGSASGQDVTATLLSASTWVQVTDDDGSFGEILPGGSATNSARPFGIDVSPGCFNGHLAPMSLLIDFSGGARDTVHFVIEVSTHSTTDPTGPCEYGYFAFDNGDTGYPEAPTYEWVEIASNQGGPGTSLGLSDFGFGQDDVITVDLPFTFTYYGETFTRASICSNGWLCMGSTWLVNYRNWNIPCAGAPPYLIAPMWDNLQQDGNDQVYHWYDADNHRYIVQWSRLENNYSGSAISNFEAILYDQEYYPTETGDGAILFQYETFNNPDALQHYSTIGIQNGDNSTGVMYGYFNSYNAGAAPISSGTAIQFVPVANVPRGTLTGNVVSLTAGGAPLEGAEVRIVESGHTFVTGADGGYEGVVPTGTYTLVADHQSFQADTAYGVPIIEDQVTTRSFALTDNVGPLFSGTTQLQNTGDEQGPYVVQTTVSEFSGIDELSLHYRTLITEWTSVPMTDLGGGFYQGEIPGHPMNSTVFYYLYGLDIGGNESFDPPDAPDDLYQFYVLMPVVANEFEDGAGDWVHEEVTGSYFVDQWHLSTQRNHTAEGTTAWKFGDEAGGDYSSFSDGALMTPAFELSSNATVRFWHWMDAEISVSYPDYAYDGGVVEVSVDGGPWTQLTPEDGYPYLIRERMNPGPFPQNTPVFSGTHDWEEETIQLVGLTGTIQIRFRFGSDSDGEAEGWYVDDVLILGTQPDFSDGQELPLLPAQVGLHQNRPNPFRAGSGTTLIQFDLPTSQPVRLQILDVSGRLVRSLLDGPTASGFHAVRWDGHNERGEQVDSGVYFYVLTTRREEAARQILLLR